MVDSIGFIKVQNPKTRSRKRTGELAKSKFYYEKFENCIGDSRQDYRFLDKIKGKSRNNPVISDLLHNHDCKIIFRSDINNNLNIFFFASTGENLSSVIPQTWFEISIKSKFSIYIYPCHKQKISKTIGQLKKKTSTGIKDISNILLKVASSKIVHHLTKLSESQSFPALLRIA